MTIFIEFKDGFYYWTLKDKNSITHNWATSLGEVFEQIIEDRKQFELKTKQKDEISHFVDRP